MPRQNDGTELFKSLLTLDVYRLATVSPGSTVTTAALAPSAALVSVSATTGFASGDPVFIIGDGGTELNACGTPALAMPLQYKAAFAQSTGAQFIEAVKTTLGYLDESGVTWSPSQQLTAINSANSALPLNYISGAGEMSVSFALLGFNIPNLQTILGITEAEIGTGTPTDPYQGSIGGLNIGTQGTQCFRLTGTRYDGKTWHKDFLNARIAVSGQTQMNRNAPAVYQATIKFTGMVMRIWT